MVQDPRYQGSSDSGFKVWCFGLGRGETLRWRFFEGVFREGCTDSTQLRFWVRNLGFRVWGLEDQHGDLGGRGERPLY